MKFAEKVVSVGVPRIIATKKRLGVALLARKLVRGVAIAVPAVGGIFGAIVAISDYRRTLSEYNKGNQNPAIAFGAAFVFDVIDVLCHAYTAFLLSGTHWHHHHVHLTEGRELEL